MKLLFVAGARPNFMKIAPIIRQVKMHPAMAWRLVHTEQHYDYEMSQVFFEELELPRPDHFLNSGSASHAVQTAKIMVEFEKVCLLEKPDLVVVVGDVNSTLACSIVAKKMHIRVAHVEAGLRSRDMAMPEEINRIVTDAISDYLFVSERSGVENLRLEGKPEDSIFLVGNVMVDTLRYQAARLGESAEPVLPGLKGPYAVVTLHRPSNVDVEGVLRGILEALGAVGADMPVLFPIHPRTKKRIEDFGLLDVTGSAVRFLPPLSYNAFLTLWKDAALVITDSGGLQEETTALGVPCFTVRENTERPVTIEEGTNTLVGTSKAGILDAYRAFRQGVRKTGKIPVFWDGKSAERIVSILSELERGR